MKMSSLILLPLLTTSLVPSCEGFAISSIRMPWSAQAANPEIERYADAQAQNKIRVRLDIGGEADGASRLAIDGIVLELQGRDELEHDYDKIKAAAQRRAVPLPGADGPNPESSSGPRSLKIVSDGSFVGPAGEQIVDLGGGRGDGGGAPRWEMIWRENSPAGALICAFDVPREVRRNEASLQKGRTYITFPVWTSSGLEKGRTYKARVEEKAAEYRKEREDAIEMVKTASNPLLKAIHYRKAYAAAEKYFESGINRMDEIPDDRDIVAIGDGLLLCKRGTVWTKNLGFGGGERVLLGTAEAKLANPEP
uniref:Uncharacterized protein n=1 Tax=Odontella aurita TaxID=265563 RepID=A0A7S4NGU2_9STRA|mmetsp:Transcript_6736/g.19943  ORF Transcript_6736/g.19943 Transcript_6736/m.19943 type:complete len:309 (+) Transcript_6736:651-1577(+)|eukprot:CAMPEP_0113538220 /NCGR_PEP_ID=MMETSP0015_2-20120614/7247_1 /TAXON_ID=2838 /ORGANISM="Odontella" /LENGTH=308 /DNA_ID=CAMNT_0000437775 /DNA_START=549 /DNA_END=1475 /DNA_ORIENTATION=+ /assembly_acc=CAM_ASM_000160